MRPDALKQLLLFLPLLALLAPGTVSALSSDREQPVHIEADRLVIDEPKGTMTYSGHARLTQGSIVLEADRVVLYSRQRRLTRAEASGNPVRFRQKTDDGHLIRARARRMEYEVATRLLRLRGEAELWQDENHIRSPRIDYDMASNRVEARGRPGTDAPPGSKPGRVEIILQPETVSDRQSGDGDPPR